MLTPAAKTTAAACLGALTTWKKMPAPVAARPTTCEVCIPLVSASAVHALVLRLGREAKPTTLWWKSSTSRHLIAGRRGSRRNLRAGVSGFRGFHFMSPSLFQHEEANCADPFSCGRCDAKLSHPCGWSCCAELRGSDPVVPPHRA